MLLTEYVGGCKNGFCAGKGRMMTCCADNGTESHKAFALSYAEDSSRDSSVDSYGDSYGDFIMDYDANCNWESIEESVADFDCLGLGSLTSRPT